MGYLSMDEISTVDLVGRILSALPMLLFNSHHKHHDTGAIFVSSLKNIEAHRE